MVSLRDDISNVATATVPLYVAMIAAYLSIRWWKLFSAEQCSGINMFVSRFSVPLLTFHVISNSDPYKMNVRLVVADTVQKVVPLVAFAGIARCYSMRSAAGSRSRAVDWIITAFSLTTLPNTLIVGIPIIKGLYGEEAAGYLVQIVVLQSIIWYTLLLVMFEVRDAYNQEAVVDIPLSPSRETIIEIESQEGTTQSGAGETEGTDKQKGNERSKSNPIWGTVFKKLMSNPNTYACLAGLVWALISFRWGVHLPLVIQKSVSIIADGGLGMAMFSLGLFIAAQSNLIACGKRVAVLALVMRFILGPGIMVISSYAIGMRGTLLNVAVVQAALPQGVVPFVFAKEYNVHPDVLSTGIIIGMIIALPMALAYYFILEL